MTSWSIREVPVPEDVGSPDAALLHAYLDAHNATIVDTWGDGDFVRTPLGELGSLHDQRYVRKLRYVVVEDGADTAVGCLAVNLPLQDNTHLAEVELSVRPEHRRRGIGTALHDEALRLVREAGRRVVTTETDQRVEPPDGPTTLAPATGSGRVDATTPAVRFARERGWDLEQVDRHSVLDLPLDAQDLADRRAIAQDKAGDDYRVVLWGSRCPDEWVDEFARLNTRMSTDVPLGGRAFEEDVWDADRVRSQERQYDERGMGMLVAAVEHVPTGTLAGYTFFLAPPDTDAPVYQEDTLVVREHRGRRLGMLLKVANLERLARERPSVRRVSTWNAEENAWMLAINVDLGFRTAGGCGAWQLRLT